jgi:hypothetical protein
MVFYLTRGHETASEQQRRLIDEIRTNKWNLPAGSYSLLVNRYQRQDLIDLLRPPRPAAANSRNGAARVYLLCDPTSPEDAEFSRVVQTGIQEKEKFQVDLRQATADSSAPCEKHERLLRGCHGLLLYHDKANAAWRRRNFADLFLAEERTGGPELKSKALLVAGAPVVIPEVTIIQRRDPFNLEQLEPFLAPLRAIAAAQGDAAHGGS